MRGIFFLGGKMLREIIAQTFEKSGVKFKPWKNGLEMRFNCQFPDHKDRNASCSINVETGLMGCFGCQGKGNIETFIYLLTGEKIEAKNLLTEKDMCLLSIEGVYRNYLQNEPHFDSYDDFSMQLKDQMNDFTGIFFQQIAYDYLKKRAITDKTILEFNLRYAPVGKYAGRIIIPYFEKGKALGFNSRLIGVDKKFKNEERYRYFVYNPLLRGYIYNFDLINPKIDYCILVEGPFDLMYLHSIGYKNVISTLNTGMKLEHIKGKLEKFKTIIFCFDNDENEAGFKSVLKNSALLKSVIPKINIRYVELPKGKDPNDCTMDELKLAFSKLRKIESPSEEGLELEGPKLFEKYI